MPEGDGPFPAIILLHGCAGINASHFRWAAILNNLGYATLAPDSYSPRSIANRCKLDAGPEVHLPRALDALGALTYLRLRDDIDTERIAIMGWSHGATMALETVSRGGLATQVSPAFKSAIAFYPYCVPDRSFDLPLLILIGEADDWSPVSRCRDLAAQNEASGKLKLITYPLAFHAFDLVEVADGFAAHGPGKMQYWVKFDPRAYQDAIFRVGEFLSEHLAPR